MTEPVLKMVKIKKKPVTKQTPKASGKQTHILHPISQSSTLTPAERAEAARFRALTKQRAARQAKVRRIVAKLNGLDKRTPANAV